MKKIHISALFSVLAIATTQEAKAATSKQSQTAGEYIDDSVVTAGVKSKIFEEKGLSSLNISVKTQDGVVTLSGTTDTAEHSQLAERVAKLVNGVKRVVNDLQVDGKKTQSAGEYIDDSAITTTVKANILKEKGLSSLDISVKTQEGIVALSGTTDTAEHSQLAERVAKQVGGVKRVINELKVK